MKKTVLGILVLMVLFGGLTIAQDAVEKGKSAPDFTLEDLKGNKVSLSDFKGKVILLNFWATWCPPCRAEMPSMERLYQEFKDSSLVVVAVSWGDAKKKVKKFVQKNNLTFVMLLDPKKETKKKYPSRYIPYSIIIDQDGIVKNTILGSKEWDSDETLLNLLRSLPDMKK
ncbi:TlpA family protein disulfide reductase [Patescibacteria group bacterium AH-259-L07]|nr:TlpA family protein disulfide reductase [Patescibacteria group bacterium AH-259-L07]